MQQLYDLVVNDHLDTLTEMPDAEDRRYCYGYMFDLYIKIEVYLKNSAIAKIIVTNSRRSYDTALGKSYRKVPCWLTNIIIGDLFYDSI